MNTTGMHHKLISHQGEGITLLERLGTLGRKNRQLQEYLQVEYEGRHAIDKPGTPVPPELDDVSNLEENEERSIIQAEAREDPKLRSLIKTLSDWLNDELALFRIVIQEPIEEDLFDGLVLQKLIEKLETVKIESPEMSQTAEGQVKRLRIVLDEINKHLQLPPWQQNKWSAEAIHSKNLISILHLLVAMARHYRAPVRLPEDVRVKCMIVQKRDGIVHPRSEDVMEQLTATYSDLGLVGERQRDAFDTLFEHAPEKLQLVKNKLTQFGNQQLQRINLEVTDISTQFHDGVYLILLMGLLEGYFVPLYAYFPTPKSNEEKVGNCKLAFELMQDAGIPQPKARPEDIVNLDLKSTLRVLYAIFSKWKAMSQ